MSYTVVPGAGDWAMTVFEAYPCTLPTTRQANPSSASVLFAKTNASLRTSGTTSFVGTAAFFTGGSGPTLGTPREAAHVTPAVSTIPRTTSAAARGTTPAGIFFGSIAPDVGRNTPNLKSEGG